MPILIFHPSREVCTLLEAALWEGGFCCVESFQRVEQVCSRLGLARQGAADPVDEVPSDQPRLLLLDTASSQGEVLAVCEQIRSSPAHRDLPILLLLTSYALLPLEEAMAVNDLSYLVQPCPPAKLLASVSAALGSVQARKPIRHRQEVNLERELALAKQVQRSALSKPLNRPAIQVDALYYTSFELSGDMYYWTEVSPGRYGILLVDVMGHGLASALISMAIRALAQCMKAYDGDPVRVMEELNKYLRLYQSHLMTAIYILIDTKAQTLEYVNAGHLPAFLATEGEVVDLARTTIPLGLSDQVETRPVRLSFTPPARLLLYTDGLLDLLRRPVVKAVDEIRRRFQEGSDLSNQAVIDFVSGKIAKQEAVKDDICLITVRLPGGSQR